MTEVDVKPAISQDLPQANNKNINIPILGSVALFFSLAAPIAALIGYFFYQGYLASFGLNSGFFPKTFQELVLGVFQALLYSFLFLNEKFGLKSLLIWGAMLLGAFTYIGILSWTSKWLSKKFDNIKWKFYFTKFNGIGRGILWFATAFIAPSLPLISILILVLPASISYSIGQRAGRMEIESFKDCSSSERPCARLYEKNELIAEGFLIEASTQFVILYSNSKARIYTLKPDSIIESNLKK